MRSNGQIRVSGSLLLLLFLVLVGGCRDGRQPVELDLFVTGDVHGSLFPEDLLTGEDTGGSTARVAAVVRDFRREKGEESVLLMDAGDLLQGQPFTYYANYLADSIAPHAVARIYNSLGYAAMTIGNHDIETGHPVYDRFVREADFPVLGANVIDRATGKPYFTPYTMLEQKGKRIAILGLTMPTLTENLPPHLWSGLDFRDQIETALELLPGVMEQKPDLLVALIHSGTGRKEGEVPSMSTNVGYALARAIPELDIVFCAHDHRAKLDSVARPWGGFTYLLDAGADGRLLSHCHVTIGLSSEGTPVSTVVPELIDLSAYRPDEDYMREFVPILEEVQTYAGQRVATLTAPMDSRSSLFRPAPFTDLIHRLQLELFPEAEISITAPLAEDLLLPAGPLRVADLFGLYRYENYACLVRLTGAELRDYLEESYDRVIRTMTQPEDPLYRIDESEADGPYLPLEEPSFNFDTAAGLSYLVDVRRPVGERITITGVGLGEAFDPDKEYLVVMNSYRAQGGGGLLAEGAGLTKEEMKARIVRTTEHDLRYYLLDFLRRHDPYEPEVISSWMYLPDGWIEVAVPRDSILLYQHFPRP